MPHPTMRTLSLAVVSAAALLGSVPNVAVAQDILTTHEGFTVIVNVANPIVYMRASDVSRFFLRKTYKMARWDKVAKPVDQGVSAVARRKFSDSVHRMDVPSVKSYWQELVFSGRGEPPPERTSDVDVVEYVRANPGAIGYVTANAQTSGVKVLTVIR